MRNRIVGQDLAEITAEDLPWERLQGARVLVTGARGILASYMVETLLYLNETRRMGIRILAAQRNRKKAQARFAHAVACPALTLLQQDVCAPFSIDGSLDYIIHAAGQSSPKFYGSDPIGTIEGHILGTRNVLALARERGVKGMLQLSSCDSYGERFAADDPTCLAGEFCRTARPAFQPRLLFHGEGGGRGSLSRLRAWREAPCENRPHRAHVRAANAA